MQWPTPNPTEQEGQEQEEMEQEKHPLLAPVAPRGRLMPPPVGGYTATDGEVLDLPYGRRALSCEYVLLRGTVVPKPAPHEVEHDDLTVSLTQFVTSLGLPEASLMASRIVMEDQGRWAVSHHPHS